MFNRLRADQAAIDQETGHILDWQDLPNRHACRIELVKENSDLADNSRWAEYIQWHTEIAIKFYRAFERRVLAL